MRVERMRDEKGYRSLFDPSALIPSPERAISMNWRGVAETLTITLAAMATSLVLFGIFMLLMAGVPPSRLYTEMFVGGFGTRFSWQNTLTRSRAAHPDRPLYRLAGAVGSDRDRRRRGPGPGRFGGRQRRPSAPGLPCADRSSWA